MRYHIGITEFVFSLKNIYICIEDSVANDYRFLDCEG